MPVQYLPTWHFTHVPDNPSKPAAHVVSGVGWAYAPDGCAGERVGPGGMAVARGDNGRGNEIESDIYIERSILYQSTLKWK